MDLTVGLQPKSLPNNKISKLVRKKKLVDKDDIITYKFYKDNVVHNPKKKLFVYRNQIIKTLVKLKIPFSKSDKKEELLKLVFSYYEKLNYYDSPDNIKHVNLVAKCIKSYLQNKKIALYGPGIIDKKICKNSEDCFTLEAIEAIEDQYFFSIKDSHGSVFFFDIRTFNKLIKKDSLNPYTREKFSNETISHFKNRIKHMEKYKLSIIYPDEQAFMNNLTPEQKIKHRLIDIFTDIDALNVVAGGTKIEWFLNLSINRLKKLYRVLEDVWNYRAELSPSKKQQIVPNKPMFVNSVNYVMGLQCRNYIQNIILNEMEKLVKTAPNASDRHTGAYFILISLTEISEHCAHDLPWLVQY